MSETRTCYECGYRTHDDLDQCVHCGASGSEHHPVQYSDEWKPGYGDVIRELRVAGIRVEPEDEDAWDLEDLLKYSSWAPLKKLPIEIEPFELRESDGCISEFAPLIYNREVPAFLGPIPKEGLDNEISLLVKVQDREVRYLVVEWPIESIMCSEMIYLLRTKRGMALEEITEHLDANTAKAEEYEREQQEALDEDLEDKVDDDSDEDGGDESESDGRSGEGESGKCS